MDYEKLGAFYLGRAYDLAAGSPREDLLLYDARDLTTHALCVGMTGSGKTGLCISLIEEAAIDGVPVIAIDPKGDLTNLLLTFPKLRPADFRPWIDASAAARKGQTPDEFAASQAALWKKGLADWGQPPARIQRFRDAVDLRIWTPGSSAGHSISVLRSLGAPPPAIREDAELLQERVQAVSAGLLGLVGVDADPLQSREAILLANIVQRAWADGAALDLPTLIRRIQSPPFDSLGVIDLETFFPQDDRMSLALRLNNLLASPGFAAWREGDALDVPKLLAAPDGRPRVSILSIAHLSDEQRMFFVAMLLNEVLAWMRTQPGTGSLRAILYMDEIAGYFPPTRMPPSKTPMLTLLKQARAFGVGVVLATQNPVDLDYKGLSNTGTWFIGRLQTERDKLRLLDGLMSAAGGGLDRGEINGMLSGLGSRVFLMHNVHDERPVVFQTRWAMSYLRGPMTRTQIEQITSAEKQEQPAASAATVAAPAVAASTTEQSVAQHEPPPTPKGAKPVFLCVTEPVGAGTTIQYVPMLYGLCRLHYARVSAKVDTWVESAFLAPLDDATADPWEAAQRLATAEPDVDKQPEDNATFVDLPPSANQKDAVARWKKALVTFAYRSQEGVVLKSKATKQYSELNEPAEQFAERVRLALREERDLKVEKLKKKYESEFAGLKERVRKAEERVNREQSQVKQQGFQAAVSLGATVLDALFGRKRSSVGRATTTMRGAGRVAREHGDVQRAKESQQAAEEKLEALEAEFAAEVAALRTGELDPRLEEIMLRPKKSDISVKRFYVAWLPTCTTRDGETRPLAELPVAGA